MMNYNNPYAQYKQTAIETANSGKLLIMLYDGAIKFLRIAIEAIEKNDNEKSNIYLKKTQDIVQEFIICLDMNVEISQKLYLLYDYLRRRLIEANIKKDRVIAEEVLQFLQELRETWSRVINVGKNEDYVENGLNIQK